MSTFPERFGADAEVVEVDLDHGDVKFRGEKLTEARAEQVAADALSRTQTLDEYLGKHAG